MTLTDDILAVTAAGEGWKWQLRDKEGRWIQLGSEVSFSHNGKTFTGIITGSPKEGYAVVKLPNGSTMTVATAGVTATGKAAVAEKSAAAPAARATAPAAAAPTASRDVKAVVPALEAEQDISDAEVERRIAAADKKAADRSAARKKTEEAEEDKKKKTKKKKSSGSQSDSDGSEGPDDARLNGTHRLSRSIESLIRIRAKEMGRKDPFGEQESDSESKDGGSKDGKSDSAAKGGAGSGSSTTKSKKSSKDTRKKLTQSQIDAVAVIMKAVLKHIKAGEYSTARGRLDAAKAVLKDTSAPWLLKRIHFLRKGVGDLEKGPVRASGAMLWAMETRLLEAITAAGGNSWQWQLRDKKGQWLDMGSRVSWSFRGKTHTGILIGSPKEGTARVRDDEDGTELNLPAANRLIALAEIGSAVRHTPGGKNPKAVLGKVIGRPVDARGREKKGRLTIRTLDGKEKEVAESTLTVLPLDSTRDAVREYGGYSVKIDGTLPKTGYMAAQLKGTAKFTPEEFFGPDGEDILMNFMRDNAAQFKADPDVYLGIWYNKDGKPPKVVIDVSHNIQDRDTAVLAGRYQDQESIWDVINQEEIDTGGTGGWEEVVRPSDERHRPDVGRGVATLVPAGDSGSEAAGVTDDRKYIRRAPPVEGLRVVDARSSMTTFGPEEWKHINNDGGTLADPRHLKEGANAMTASMSEMADHFTEVILAARESIPESDHADLKKLAVSDQWYAIAHQTCQDLFDKYQDQIPGLTMAKVTGVMAAMSPRMSWEKNIVACEKVLKHEALPEFRALPISKAKKRTKAGLHTYVEDSLQILRGESDPNTIMGGLKRKSFWNCMLDPTNTWDVCIDGWMMSATRRAGLTYQDGSDLDEGALEWLEDGKGTLAMGNYNGGAGYVVIADAIRVAAARVDLTPMQAQAVYWTSVGGGEKGAIMWTDERRARGESLKALGMARRRELRLAKALKPIEVPA